MFIQLSPQEISAFERIADILKEHGSLERDALRVRVASRGGELGRDYLRLRDLGLINEVERRPGFLEKLLGAKPGRIVSLSDFGQLHLTQLAVPAHPAEEFAKDLNAEADETLSAVVVDEHVVALFQKADIEVQTRSKSSGREVSGQEIAVYASADPTFLANVELQGEEERPPEKTTAMAALKSRRLTPQDYTEVLGGTALDDGFELHDSERLSGLAELLGLLGFELTPAGRLLAANRWAEERSDAEVLVELLLTSIAHAARLHESKTATLDIAAMTALIDEIGRALQPLVTEGDLSAQELATKIATMFEFVGKHGSPKDALYDFLSDPLRGVAPPAIAPDAVWIIDTTFEDGATP